MAEFRVHPGKPISCSVTVPGDKSISHRSVMIAALSEGVCQIDGFLASEDCWATIKAFRAMGVRIDVRAEEKRHGAKPPGSIHITVHGVNGRLRQPPGPLDCGNSGTTMRLMCGLLAAQPFRTELVGDASLSKRPMKRVMEPLGHMGARIEARGPNGAPPLVIEGGKLTPIHYTLAVASAQVKSAVLFAGLFTKGKTIVSEPVATRDHTERMFERFGVALRREGRDIILHGGQSLVARDFTVPGDISSAAFWLVAAAAQPGSELHVLNVGLNPTRTGILNVLARMGAQVQEVVETVPPGEAAGRVVVRGTHLRGVTIGGDEIPNVIDELPILAVAAALARGTTIIKDAQELRVKETDRIAAVAHHLREMGVIVREHPDGMEIDGRAGLTAPRQPLPSYGDHRIAMAFAIAGLFAEGETIIEGVECVDTSYPGFEQELERFQSHQVSGEIVTSVISVLAVKRKSEAEPIMERPEEVEDSAMGGLEAYPPSEPVVENQDRPEGGDLVPFVAPQTEARVCLTSTTPPTGVVVAIDGPAASGKSSVARKLARQLSFAHVNTGAIYRAVTWAVLEAGVDPADGVAVAHLLPRVGLACALADGHSMVLINGTDPEPELHSPAVNDAVSAVSRVPEVREKLLPLQRGFAGVANVVVEGRDIGSVVFPQTPFKYYIDASPDVRRQRRAAQGLTDSVTARDSQDSTRVLAPLTRADGAAIIDSSDLGIDEVVGRIIEDLRAKGLVA